MVYVNHGERVIVMGKQKTVGVDYRAQRKQAGVSQLEVAARARKSLPVVRLFEANPEAVSAESRAALEPVYAELCK